MQSVALNIDSRGHIRLPQKIRNMFDKSVILKVIDEEHVMISPIEDIGGSFAKYKKNAPKSESWDKIRQTAWERSTKGRG